MHGFRASGVCLLLASIAAILLSKGGFRQRALLVSRSRPSPGENDIVVMLQRQEDVKLSRAKKETAKHMSADLAKVRTTIRNPNVPTVSPPLAPNAEPEVMSAVVSDDGRTLSHLHLGLASLDMWYTQAIRSWRSAVLEESSSGFVPMLIFLFLAALGGSACILVIASRLRWASDRPVHAISQGNMSHGKADKGTPFATVGPRDNALSVQRTSTSPARRLETLVPTSDVPSPSLPKPTPTPTLQRTSPNGEARFSLPMTPLREAIESGNTDTNDIMIVDKVGEKCLHVALTKMIGGARIEVSTPEDNKAHYRVTVGPPPNTSQVNPKSLMIYGLRGTSSNFMGSLEEQVDGSYTVLQDNQPVMCIRPALDSQGLVVSGDHGNIASIDHIASIDRLDIRVKEKADAILVLACALTVIIRLLL